MAIERSHGHIKHRTFLTRAMRRDVRAPRRGHRDFFEQVDTIINSPTTMAQETQRAFLLDAAAQMQQRRGSLTMIHSDDDFQHEPEAVLENPKSFIQRRQYERWKAKTPTQIDIFRMEINHKYRRG